MPPTRKPRYYIEETSNSFDERQHAMEAALFEKWREVIHPEVLDILFRAGYKTERALRKIHHNPDALCNAATSFGIELPPGISEEWDAFIEEAFHEDKTALEPMERCGINMPEWGERLGMMNIRIPLTWVTASELNYIKSYAVKFDAFGRIWRLSLEVLPLHEYSISLTLTASMEDTGTYAVILSARFRSTKNDSVRDTGELRYKFVGGAETTQTRGVHLYDANMDLLVAGKKCLMGTTYLDCCLKRFHGA